MYIIKNSIFLALALLLIGAASASATVTTNWQSGNWTSGGGAVGDAANLRSSFLSTYNAQTQDFDGFSANKEPGTLGLNLGFATLTGGGYVSNNDGVQNYYNEYAVSGANFYSNGTIGNTGGKSDFTITFNSTQNALGFYAIDWQDNGGEVELSLKGGDTQSINFGEALGDPSSGSLFYITLLSTAGFDSVTFKQSGGDGYAIDDLSVASTPIPGAIWLLGSGLLGMVGLRRRKMTA